MPRETAAACGMDILFHSIESMVSDKSNWLTHQLGSQAISMVVENLPLVYDDRPIRMPGTRSPWQTSWEANA
jgi:alcohol dehydrogenase class IV